MDGDRRYSEKSIKYYRELGLNAVVKNIAENQQPYVVRRLLERYKPDILIVTGDNYFYDRNLKQVILGFWNGLLI